MKTGRWLLVAAAALVALLVLGWLAPRVVLDGYFAALRVGAGAERHQRVIGDHAWVWLESGAGPPVLLLHGFTGMKENWLPLVGDLAQDFRVIAPDLPGWGASERVDGADYGYAAQAQRLQEYIEALALQEVVLVGHSMGGGIAALVAAADATASPPRLRALVLMDASGAQFEANAFGREVLRGGHPFAVADAEDLRHYLALVFADPPWVPWPLSRAMVQRRIADRRFEQDVLSAISRSDAAFAPQQAAAAVQVPTLLLWCRDDRVIDASAADSYAVALGARLHGSELLQGCNHMPMMERPAAVAAALRRFIEGLR